MKRALVDLSSVLWTSLLAGEDKEFGRKVTTDAGKTVTVNSATWGYENALNHLTSVMEDLNVTPRQMIFVVEGKNSKADRQALHPGYKAGRDKVAEQYEQFNLAKEQVLDAFLKVGAQAVWQDGGVEADDVIGYLAKHLKGERWIVSADKDLAQCVGGDVHHWRSGAVDRNPFGDFPHHLIPVYIALVGDSSDKIPGAKGFGETAFTHLLGVFETEGLETMLTLIKQKRLAELKEDVGELKSLQKIVDDAEGVYLSYELGRLRIERVNTLRRPLQWRVGMVRNKVVCEDERLRKYAGTVRIVSAENYDETLPWLRKQIALSPEIALDVETSTPEESDQWLAQADKEDKVDVLGSELTSLQLTFGRNMEHTVYLPVDNVPEAGIGNLSFDQVRDVVDMIPREKVTLVHNAAFELPVCYMAWGEDWKRDPEWHGFLRNVRDTRIMAHYVDENRQLGLKSLSKDLLGYDQITYDEVTTKTYAKADYDAERMGGKVLQRCAEAVVELRLVDVPFDTVDSQTGEPCMGVRQEEQEVHVGDVEYVTVQHKMNELTARQVLHYGADDTICTAAIANHFRAVMEIENTLDVFEEVETLPAYVQARAFLDGVDFSLERMRAMEKDDDKAYDEAWATLRAYLIKIGFEGTQCPVFEELSPATIKEAFQIVAGTELKTQVRTLSKIAKLIEMEAEGHENGENLRLLAHAVVTADFDTLNALVKRHFRGEPQLNLGSSKQMKELLYTHLQLPVRIINDVTDKEKAEQPDLADAVARFKKKRAGSSEVTITDEDQVLLRKKAKADDTAIQFALAFDTEYIDDESRAALKALGAMKKVMTRRSLFYKNYWHAKHWKDGKIHASITQCGAVTRRPTASSPNVYQLPKKGEGVRFRENFLPHHKDAVVGSIDWSGQELRLAAERSQDRNLLACYVGDNLKDVHSITAAGAMKLKWGAQAVHDLFDQYASDLERDVEGQYRLFLRLREQPKDNPIKKKADDLRKDSKNVNFTAQFGGQAPKIAERLIMPIEDAQLFLDARSEMFPDVDAAAERAEDECMRTGYALTMLGARRHLRDSVLSDDKWLASRAARQAWNMEIQGSAGEMAKKALSRMWSRGIPFRYDFRFFFCIYDELVFSVHRDHAIDAIREVHECMTAPYASMTVPILGSISLGPDFANQIECGDWFIEENIRKALNDIFQPEEACQ